MEIIQIILPYAHDESALRKAVEQKLGTGVPFRILKKSVDARQHRNIKVQYAITAETVDPAEGLRHAVAIQTLRLDKRFAESARPRPVIVGTGPGGIFSALWLLRHGFHPLILEQGPSMSRRLIDMARFMKHGDLQPRSNICFGAGGAGTYSDGKLITRIRSPYISYVMSTFVEHGAPEEIRYLYNPHLGSNKIRQCIRSLLEMMQRAGTEIRYDTKLTGMRADDNDLIVRLATDRESIDAPAALFLAAGHSSRDTYAMLRKLGVEMEVKEFAMGVRVEHSVAAINEMQYGPDADSRYPGIETAQYKLARTWKDENRAVYSFCMCPGGYVLNASTDTAGVVTNGMSNYRKSGRFSNAAIVVNVTKEDLAREGYSGVDAAQQMQIDYERIFCASVNTSGRSNVVPGQRLVDFMHAESSTSLAATSCLNPVAPSAMHSLLPAYIFESLRRGFHSFDRNMPRFSSSDAAQIFGIESRTSSPYRILRDEHALTSPTFRNLYPVGEGAGYAGGITSAAVDGIRCAQAWISTFVETEEFS